MVRRSRAREGPVESVWSPNGSSSNVFVQSPLIRPLSCGGTCDVECRTINRVGSSTSTR